MWHILTHWGRVTHICVSKLSILGSDNGLSPGRRQAIIWTKDVILLIRTLGTNSSEMLIKINTFSLKKMHLKMSPGRWQPSCHSCAALLRLHWILLILDIEYWFSPANPNLADFHMHSVTSYSLGHFLQLHERPMRSALRLCRICICMSMFTRWLYLKIISI